jgi:NAD(P)-dependent dehydrogenase (short-subunit alcohol dehydrogenase family)
MELGLKGRRVLITGGSQGIGYTVAEGFLDEGCSVVIVSKNEGRLRSAIESLSKKWGRDRVSGKAIDLSLSGAAAALADAYSDTDILINNAGAIPSGDIFEVDEARWREAWDLKVFGYINLMRAMFAHMRDHPPKVILNVIGMGAERPQWRYVCGNAANVALNGVTKSLGGRSLDHGVRVLGVNPGAVETERVRTLLQSRAEKTFGDASRWREVLSSTLPHGRAAKTKEIADVVVFLASDRAAWVCGEVVNLDAGNIYRSDLF